MADTIKYNPNTGALLKPGETVWDIANNRLITQGQELGSGVAYTAAQNAAAQAGSKSTPAASVAINTPAVISAPVTKPSVASAPVNNTPAVKPVAATVTATPAATPVSSPVSSYSGSSIVDFLNQSGQASNFAARSALATRYGIANYTGTAAQNTQLLGILKGQTAQPSVTTQTPSTGQPGTAGTQINTGTNQPADVEAIKTKIEQVKAQIATAQSQYEKELGVQNLVQEAAKLGLDYPQEYLDSLIVPEKSDSELRQAIYDKYGIANLETSAFQAPEKTYSQIYMQALADLGLTAQQEKLTAAQAELDKATADYDAGVAEINKNPWKSESGRTGSVRRIFEAYSAEATRLQAKVTLAQNAVDQIKEDAKSTATQTVAELSQNQQLDQQKLEYLTAKAEDELTAQKEMQKETTSKELARYYPEYVKNLSTSADKTQIVNIGGQEILYAYDSNGKVISKTVLGTAGSGTTGTATERTTEVKKAALAQAAPELKKSKGTDGYVDPEIYMNMRTDYAAAVGDVSEFDDAFASMLSPAERQRLGIGKYSAASVAGTDDAASLMKQFGIQ